MAAADTRLVRKALTGDPVAFGDLVVQYSPLVYSVLLAIIRRREPLEDLAQEAFIKAYQARGSLRDSARFGPWLAQIARRTALDWCTTEKTRISAVEALAQDDWRPAPDGPDDEAHHRHLSETLWGALDRLDESSRQLLLLRHVEGCSYRDVARFLGGSTARVFQQTRRAEASLAREMVQVLRSRSTDTARRLVLRASVLGALALARPGDSAVLLTPVATGVETGKVVATGKTVTTWKVVAACFGISVALHMGGLLTDTARPQQQGSAALQVAPTAADAARRLIVTAPAGDVTPLGQKQDPPEVPDVPPVPVAQATVDGAVHVVLAQLVTESLTDVTGGGIDRARALVTDASEDTVAPAAGGPTSMHVALYPLRLRGAGSFSGGGSFLDDLYRFLPTCCGITVEIVGTEGTPGFYDPRLLAAPLHFLFEGGGEASLDRNDDLRLSGPEERLMRQYLDQGGLLYFEGDPQYLQTATALLHRIAPEGAQLVSIPQDHPIYTAAYDLTGGFPGEHRRAPSDSLWAARWQLPPADLANAGFAALWGLEREGVLLAVLSGHSLFRKWQPDVFATKSDSIPPPIKVPLLQAAANIVVYAMHRPH